MRPVTNVELLFTAVIVFLSIGLLMIAQEATGFLPNYAIFYIGIPITVGVVLTGWVNRKRFWGADNFWNRAVSVRTSRVVVWSVVVTWLLAIAIVVFVGLWGVVPVTRSVVATTVLVLVAVGICGRYLGRRLGRYSWFAYIMTSFAGMIVLAFVLRRLAM